MSLSSPPITIRRASRADAPLLLELVDARMAARRLDDWVAYRLTREDLARLAGEDPGRSAGNDSRRLAERSDEVGP